MSIELTMQENKKGRTIPILITAQLLIAIVSVIIMVIVGLKIKPLIEKKSQLESEAQGLEKHNKELQELNARLEQETAVRQRKLEETTNLIEAQIQPKSSKAIKKEEVIAKVENESDKRKEALDLAFKLKERGIKFTWGGKNPQEGFDSSGFIAYVLSKQNIAKYPDLTRHPEKYYSGLLAQVFGKRPYNSEIQVGDIIFYEAGICMFYVDNNSCIGMLPGGIQVKEVEFGFKLLGYGRVDYK